MEQWLSRVNPPLINEIVALLSRIMLSRPLEHSIIKHR